MARPVKQQPDDIDRCIISYIDQYRHDHHRSPSLRQIGNEVDLTAQAIRYRLEWLAEQGVVAYDKGETGTVQVIQTP